MDTLQSDFQAYVNQTLEKALASPDKSVQEPERDGKIHIITQLSRAETPSRHVESLNCLERKPIIEVVDRWRKTKQWLLLLGGEVGVGKSFAAAYWFSRHISKHGLSATFPARWVQANDLLHMDKAEYKRLWWANAVVIDDLGAEYYSEKGWFLSILYSILSHRYDNMLKTIITTNLSTDKLASRYDDPRFVRRLKHDATLWYAEEDNA